MRITEKESTKRETARERESERGAQVVMPMMERNIRKKTLGQTSSLQMIVVRRDAADTCHEGSTTACKPSGRRQSKGGSRSDGQAAVPVPEVQGFLVNRRSRTEGHSTRQEVVGAGHRRRTGFTQHRVPNSSKQRQRVISEAAGESSGMWSRRGESPCVCANGTCGEKQKRCSNGLDTERSEVRRTMQFKACPGGFVSWHRRTDGLKVRVFLAPNKVSEDAHPRGC